MLTGVCVRVLRLEWGTSLRLKCPKDQRDALLVLMTLFRVSDDVNDLTGGKTHFVGCVFYVVTNKNAHTARVNTARKNTD